ncbi:MAG TPA: hypothetical protein VF702_14520 [Allosphingosinicella sp.]|jgi:hypothetical protein
MKSCFVAMAALLALAAQPCLAADDFRDLGAGERRSSAFAGVRLRLPLGAEDPERPSARLQVATFHDYRNATGAMVRSHRSDGIEIGMARTGAPALFVGGRNVAAERRRLEAKGSTGTTLLIVGGVVLIVVVLAAVASAMPQAGPDEGAFD